MSESTPNIYQRINKVMDAVGYVQKDKTISGGGAAYKAVSHDNVVAQIRKELVSNGIVIVPRQISGTMLIHRDLSKDQKMHLYSGSYEIDFVNIDTPADKATVTIEAHAADNGDKAPGKAITYATKAAILKIFSLETGEDEESRTAEIDMSEPVATLLSAASIQQLGDTFKSLWNSYDGKVERAELVRVKDLMKKKLMEQQQ